MACPQNCIKCKKKMHIFLYVDIKWALQGKAWIKIFCLHVCTFSFLILSAAFLKQKIEVSFKYKSNLRKKKAHKTVKRNLHHCNK